jgi:hypothetical protein
MPLSSKNSAESNAKGLEVLHSRPSAHKASDDLHTAVKQKQKLAQEEDFHDFKGKPQRRTQSQDRS